MTTSREAYRELVDIVMQGDASMRYNAISEWRKRWIHTLYVKQTIACDTLKQSTFENIENATKSKVIYNMAEKLSEILVGELRDEIAFPGKSITYAIDIICNRIK